MNRPEGLVHGPPGAKALHLCVDMQRLFAEDTPWRTPWMSRVLPIVACVAGAAPERTVFTRFVPVQRSQEARGAWQGYWEKWRELTLEQLDPGLIDLVEPLAALVPPARVLDKRVYSPWTEQRLEPILRAEGIDTLIITGAETDMCVLATVLGAVDRGFRVILVADGLCGSSDKHHDALIDLYHERFSQQVEVATAQEILAEWPGRPEVAKA